MLPRRQFLSDTEFSILGTRAATKNILCEGNILFYHPALFSFVATSIITKSHDIAIFRTANTLAYALRPHKQGNGPDGFMKENQKGVVHET